MLRIFAAPRQWQAGLTRLLGEHGNNSSSLGFALVCSRLSRDAVAKFLSDLAAKFPDVRWYATNVVFDGESNLAVEWVSTRTIGGKSNRVQGASVMRLKDGKSRPTPIIAIAPDAPE
ncbi:nuclear transport factor 2 family protein [Tardiphaga sp. vice352]|uniref:nuclear transport factor 2 family protein n=1 Tax=unclassified Tardiphaga TaxID=2631404 RepID=UPI00116506A7|nr:nuclear transport factor 2 family protein [Tardiphaga sp.]QDM15898.1 nuclear transport factor 2 family protein [Tardiphaga sp. vice278]QDM20999.1 nuclear transport factor 2 family protein [Tardiphaga sp. vice154]QDM26095.1 nuclear transport factor 2 family protein [Tardiphaga sp. vice304]QDM31243.1 nuclear transport factor 2 family protein [Tardiphaga sp. vice352]